MQKFTRKNKRADILREFLEGWRISRVQDSTRRKTTLHHCSLALKLSVTRMDKSRGEKGDVSPKKMKGAADSGNYVNWFATSHPWR